MNTLRDPDAVLGDWLEEGPTRLPESVSRAIDVGTRTTTQHQAALRLPWRFAQMTPATRIALAIVTLVVVGGGSIYLVAQRGGAGGPPSSPVATLAPAASLTPTQAPPSTATSSPARTPPVAPSSELKTFTSPRYGYSIDYPSNWRTRPSTGEITAIDHPYDGEQRVDYLSASAPLLVDPALVVAAPKIDAGTTLDNWVSTIDGLVGCAPTGSTAVQIGGEPGRLITFDNCLVDRSGFLLWAGVLHGDRAYHIVWLDQYAMGNPALQATDRSIFTRMLASFTFEPGAAPSP